MFFCSVCVVAPSFSVLLCLVCDVQWKFVEGSHCDLIPSAVPTVGSVECGKLPEISVKVLDFSREISFEMTENK
jgi:hypothetical protein